MVADISDETAAAITKAEAWPAYNAFFRLLWKRQREAEKAKNDKALAYCQAGILIGEGVRGLARSIGLSPKAMDRQLRELHRLGILAVAKPPAAIARDAKGRIVRRPSHKGLVPASKIRFTAGDSHKRPRNRQGSNRPLKVVGAEASQGSNRPLKGGRLKGRFDTTPISPRNISPSAGGHADGVGRPAEDRHGRPAAGQEAPPLRPWTGPAEEARQAMLRRMEADKAAYAAREAETAAASQEAARPPRNATEAAARLGEAVASLPPASRQKARREARRLSREDRKAEADAKSLSDLIEQKRRQEQDNRQANAEAFKAKAKAASRKARNTNREGVTA